MRYSKEIERIEKVIDTVLIDHPERLERCIKANYRQKFKVRGFFIGMIFKKLAGRCDYKMMKKILNQRLGLE